MRNASQRLYDTLSQLWSCPKHLEHSANICLDQSPNRVNSDKVCFDMVFTFSRPLNSASIETPMRVIIESMLEQSEEAADSNTLPEPAVNTVTATSIGPERIAKTVSFALPVTTKSTIPESVPLDLCSVQNICFYIQKCLQTPSASSPIGYLQRTKTFKHIIYPPKTINPCTNPIVSLSDTIRTARTSRGMWIPEKLRLAKLLALAVLEFHSTPWLNGRWRSQDILFFDSKDPTQDPFGSPYLAARFTKPLEPATCELSDPKLSKSEPWSPAPNVILFRLGVILLELGLETPLSNLQESQEQRQGQTEIAEFCTATQLALKSAVLGKMGPRYATLVNRCIFCDFGLGGSYSLDMIELQNMFFQYVVMELDACLKLVSEL